MINKLISTVPDSVKELPAAVYLDRSFPLLGKNRIRELIRTRQLRINGERCGEGAVVRGGDEVCLYAEGVSDRTIRILYDDGNILSFIKPAGIPVDTDGDGIGEDTVLSRLRSSYPTVRLVHRLDTGTDGVMLAALNDNAEKELTGLFRNHGLVKLYSACVLGSMPKKHEELRAFLVKDSAASKVHVTGKRQPGALEIETIYTVRKEVTVKGQTLSYLTVEIPTGRTHQIRAHLSHIGHPLLGDDKYGDRDLNKKLKAAKMQLTCCEIRVKPGRGVYSGFVFALPEEKRQ